MREARGPSLHIRSTGLGYPGRALVAGFDLTLEGPGLWFLSGPPGCGKSSLLLALAGAPPTGLDAGAIEATLDGEPLAAASPRERLRSALYAFQDPTDQLLGLDVEAEAAFRLESLALPPAEIRRRVDAALPSLGLATLARRDTSALSGGEARRATLACAWALDVPLLLLDEPLANLDPPWRRRVEDDLATLARRALVVVAEHRAPGLARVARGALAIREGRLERRERRAVDASPPLPLHGVRPRAAAEPALVADGLTLRAPDDLRLLVQGLSLSLGCGLLAMAGPNGSGKTTLLRHAAGVGEAPAQGRMRAAGPVRLVFQRARDGFFRDTLAEELATGTPHDPKDGAIALEARRWGLAELLDADPHRLSGGEAQAAAIANALLSDPRLLLLDEPTHGLGEPELSALAARLGEESLRRLTVVATHEERLLAAAPLILLLPGDGTWRIGTPVELREPMRELGYGLDAVAARPPDRPLEVRA